MENQYKNNSLFSALHILAILTWLIIINGSCKKLVDVNAPENKVTTANAFDNDATAAAVLTGIYSKVSQTPYSTTTMSLPSLSAFAGLSADELTLWSGLTASSSGWNKSQAYYYTNTLYSDATGTIGGEFWTNFYNIIYTCNAALEGLSNSSSLTTAVQQQLIGETKFLRALFYFYQTNLYGDVPLVLSTDYKANTTVAGSSKEAIYKQIISDLIDAKGLLGNNYVDATVIKTTTERVRPNKYVASALLARAYLFQNDWANAEAQATEVINAKNLYDTIPLNNVFLKNSKEAIWQLQPVNTGWNTEDARLFIFPTSAGPTNNNPLYLSNSLLNNFEAGDQRRVAWVNSIKVGTNTYFYPYKYKSAIQNASISEYAMIFRLAEQYLIRAEARAEQGNLSGAASDLNVIRTRARLPNTTAINQGDMLSAILHERQIELFTELGHRWLDIKRTGNVDAIMSAAISQKPGASWQSYKQLYPLPYNDLQLGPNLEQNKGY